MLPPPHREKDAKVEGRDLSAKAKQTMGAFKALTKRLLNVPMSEVKERQRLYDESRSQRHDKPNSPKLKRKRVSLLADQKASDKTESDFTNSNK
jgi:hypothetical protein